MEELVFRLHGNNIKPESFRSKDLGELLIKFEDSIRAIIKESDPDLKDDEIFFPVVEIQDQSLGLKYSPNLKTIVTAFTLIGTSFSGNNFDQLPSKSIDDLRDVQSKIRKYNCVGEFKVGTESIGEIKPESEIKISEKLKAKGDTTIYGKLVRVGGVEPKARIELLEGYTISATITESLAQEIAKDLYNVISLNGEAVWNLRDNFIIEFVADSRGQYQESSNREGFKELQTVLGEYWDKIDNIEETLDRS